MKPVDLLLSRLDKVRGKHPKWQARCPAHSDNSPSLSIKEKDDGTLLVHCFAGCGGADVMTAIGLSMSDLFPDRPHTEYDSGDDWKPEKRPARFVIDALQDEIYRLRAEASK